MGRIITINGEIYTEYVYSSVSTVQVRYRNRNKQGVAQNILVNQFDSRHGLADARNKAELYAIYLTEEGHISEEQLVISHNKLAFYNIRLAKMVESISMDEQVKVVLEINANQMALFDDDDEIALF